MDRTAFFAELRGSALFPHGFSQDQVAGINRLLDVWDDFYRGPLDEIAYDLATSHYETAGTMEPITERGARSYFDKYEPGTKLGKALGNTQPGDGYPIPGRRRRPEHRPAQRPLCHDPPERSVRAGHRPRAQSRAPRRSHDLGAQPVSRKPGRLVDR